MVKLSKSQKKTLNYLLNIFDEIDFSDFILYIRKKYKIPLEGYKGSANFREKEPIPLVWMKDVKKVNPKSFISEIDKFLKSKSIPTSIAYKKLFLGIIFYNAFDLFDENDLMLVSDMKLKIEKNNGEDYPVLFRISPYATERDILDYIKHNYKEKIEPIQKKYKLDSKPYSSKIRNWSKYDRDRFIYDNQDLSLREISRLVGVKFSEYLDVGHIGKIISICKKKWG